MLTVRAMSHARKGLDPRMTNREGGMRNLRVNGERLWASLMGIGRDWCHTEGRVRRLAASDLDGEARRLLIRWCEAAGCIVRVNRISNIFARRPGRDPSLPAVMTGQPSRHPADRRQVRRRLWAIAGLEVVRTLNELGYETEAAIEIVVWTNRRARASRRRWSARGYSAASSLSPRVWHGSTA
jgi:hypothetical protein